MTPFEVWNAGLTLAAALDRWGGGAALAEDTARVFARFRGLAHDPRSPLTDRPATLQRLSDMGHDWEEHCRRQQDLYEAFRDRLRRCEFVAFAFSVEDGGAQRLAAVSPETWGEDCRIDWGCSCVARGRDAFEDVRVLPREAVAVDGRDDPRLTSSRSRDG